jgi:hypothetical protein
MKVLESTNQSTLDGVVQVGVENRVKFSRPALIRHLVNFIVADDQVCAHFSDNSRLRTSSQSINVIECPEFRTLMLMLCSSITDTDIPRCSSLRQSILNTWVQTFDEIKVDMNVRIYSYQIM